MKVVLLENIKKLGKKDEIVEVSDGYARNVLIAKNQALPATPTNLNNLKLKNKNEEKKEENLKNIAIADKEKIEKGKITLSIKAGSNGKAFGSITSKEISDAIKENMDIDIDKKDILLDESIKNLGNYDVKVRLHKDIFATVKLQVKEA